MKRVWTIVLVCLLVVGMFGLSKVLAAFLGTIIGGEVTVDDGSSTLWLYVNSNDTAQMDWSEIGIQPYLDAIDTPSGYITIDETAAALEGDFGFSDSGISTATIISVSIQIFGIGENNNLETHVWNGAEWASLGSQTLATSWEWVNYTATTVLDTWAKIDAAKIYLVADAETLYNVDCARLQVEYNSAD